MKHKEKKQRFKRIEPYLYILPWLIGLIVFQCYPFISSFIYSLTNKTMSQSVNFIGLENYVRIFTTDPDFYAVIKATFIYVIIAVPGKVFFALFIAMVLNTDVRGVNIFRTVYYLPSIFGGSVAISVIWRFLFQKRGIANHVLSLLGLSSISWLGNPSVAPFTIALVPVWQFGSSMVLFLAALKNVPRSLYEAGSIDGINRTQGFFHITLPCISPILLFNLIMQTVTCFQEFSTPFIITSGGPNKATFLYGIKLYREAFTSFRMGYASAHSWILFSMILIFTATIFLTSRFWVFYGDEK